MWQMFDSRRRCKKLIMNVLINGKQVVMELVLQWWSSEECMVRCAGKETRTEIDVKFLAKLFWSWNCGHEIVVAIVTRKPYLLPVIITKNDSPVLTGHNWLFVLKLDWGLIKQVSIKSIDRLEALQIEFFSLLDGELGTAWLYPGLMKLEVLKSCVVSDNQRCEGTFKA